MPKKIKAVVKLQIPGGLANPAPPVGPSLGQHGVNIMEFCKTFNSKTSSHEGTIIPVIITIFDDKSFTFITKEPPVSVLIKKHANIEKGSGEPNKNKVAKISKEQVKKIAEQKMSDLNAVDVEGAMRIVEGTARSMGVVVE